MRGIVFVPDYLANAGGVIDFHQETINDQPDAVLASVARIGAITRDVLRCAAATGATPLSVADGIVRARIIRRTDGREMTVFPSASTMIKSIRPRNSSRNCFVKP